MQENHPLTLPQITQHLLQNPTFLTTLRTKLSIPTPTSISITQPDYNALIQQLSSIITMLIQQKLQNQMQTLIADNNNLLEHIKQSIQKMNSDNGVSLGLVSKTSFMDLKNVIEEQKEKVQEQFDQDCSIDRNVGISKRVIELQKKVKAMQEKYQTNFKSLWNVLSMTQSAVFDYIKENKSKEKSKLQTGLENSTLKKQKNIFSFWKD